MAISFLHPWLVPRVSRGSTCAFFVVRHLLYSHNIWYPFAANVHLRSAQVSSNAHSFRLLPSAAYSFHRHDALLCRCYTTVGRDSGVRLCRPHGMLWGLQQRSRSGPDPSRRWHILPILNRRKDRHPHCSFYHRTLGVQRCCDSGWVKD